MAKSSRNEFALSVMCTLSAVAGVAAGYYFHNAIFAVLSLIPAAVYEIFYIDEPTTNWAKWGLFIVINLEAALIAGNAGIDVAHYLAKVTSDLPVMDLRMVLPILIAYFSYILARKTQGIYTRWLGLLMLACSMNLLHIVDKVLR